jgi:hypothetical protein
MSTMICARQRYGGGPAIPREVIKRGYSRTLAVDVRLHRIQLHKSSALATPVPMSISKYATIRQLRDKGCALLGLNPNDVQLWDYHQHVKAKLLSDLGETLHDENIIDQQPVLFEERNADGTWPRLMRFARFTKPPVASLCVDMFVFD